jgi:hypothetical protein
MVNLTLDPDIIPGLKLGLHSFQIILSFVAWCLIIVVLNNDQATVNGQIGWAFGVCFLSVPAWIFLIMTPRWQRSKKFAEPHAMLVVDAIWAIFWLSAFASMAAFNSANRCGSVCGPSSGVVAMGVLVFLLFIGSTFVSIVTLKHYQFHGSLPGYDKRTLGVPANNYDPDKTAFSMAPDGDEPYARLDNEDPDHDVHGEHLPHVNDHNTGYGGAASMNSRYGAGESALDSDLSGGYGGGGAGSYPSRNPTPLFDSSRYSPRPDETTYDGGYNSRISSPAIHQSRTQGDSPYDDNVARFPAANYGA